MSTLEGGTYEIIQSRLEAQKQDLNQRLAKLNEARKEVFGSIETKLIANNRIITENNCIPADIVTVGTTSIFGYNVHFGLRTDVGIKDVFSLYSYDGGEFKPMGYELLEDETFLHDFANLYKYYRDTNFRKFFIAGQYLYMVFQLSERVTDVKAFKWLIADGALQYVDNRSDHEYRFPTQHDFIWQETTREMQRYGLHPHVSILNKVFVETVGGTLTIKVEDNTTVGKGLYDEEVIHPDQTLDDGTFKYADLGNLIALQIKPFQEEPRYFIYNHKLQQVQKADSLKSSAILLPDQQGIIFSDGYYLQTGEYKIFESSLPGLLFQERIVSPNGEDFMYVFYESKQGQYVLLSYNLITQEIKTPIICNGFTILKDGELCYFKSEGEPVKNHVVQIWQTPFIKGDILPSQHKDSLIYKIGNKDIVKAMAESQALITLLSKNDGYEGLYADLTRQSQNILDAYYWINSAETYELNIPLAEIKSTANAAIDEFEKVVQLRQNAKAITRQTQEKADKLFGKIKSDPLDNIDVFVANLAALRTMRGEVISLKEIRYVDTAFIEALETRIIEETERISQHCVQFLLDDKALSPYQERVHKKQGELDGFTTVAEGKKLEAEVGSITADLEMLIDIVTNLKIDDTSQSTRIINNISLIFATLNRLKADIKNRISTLGGKEAIADFAAQMKLADQAVANALDRASTPEKTEELLNKISVQLEEIEARFADFEEFTGQILEKREEIQNAFEAKKNALRETRNKKAIALQTAAERILKSVAGKALTFTSQEDINGYFAGDLMVSKLRGIQEQLQELEDSGKAEAISTALKSAREDAVRRLKDRSELYEDGENIIKLGKHRFAVNRQPLDLTIVYKDDTMLYHLTGTDFYQEVKDSTLLTYRNFWNQDLVSENATVYRAAYLAWKVFSSRNAQELYNMTDEALRNIVTEETAKNYTEGYIKGVHDTDAFIFLKTLVVKHHTLGLLRYTPTVRAFAKFYWHSLSDESRNLINASVKAAGSVLKVFPNSNSHQYIIEELGENITAYATANGAFNLGISQDDYKVVSACLFEELQAKDTFSVSIRAKQLLEHFYKALDGKGATAGFKNNLGDVPDAENAIRLALQWATSWLEQAGENTEYAAELAALLLYKNENAEPAITVLPDEKLTGLAGSHLTIIEGSYIFHYHEFVKLLNNYTAHDVPAFEAFRKERQQLTLRLKNELRLNEFLPKVLTSFVRNKLIDQVYLPLFGDNLAKQLGAAGDNTRTDRSGMLLLVSPPGYGKTTLMEYLANRLGLVFMKINGPAIGHDITSVDPLSATNSAAREELKKLNLALEMGNNVMLYLDDIQHCSPEFLQKFISLADGTRKMEGVYKGQPKTYDLKSKRFCVVMAGNPYTETGEKFRIPDMLANRADIYNLGDVIGNTASLFELSLIENALTANPVLAQLASRNMDDLYAFITMAETGKKDGIDLTGNYAAQEIETFVSVLDKVIKVRNVVLKANAAYIASAAMEDAYRTEPPFRLQGSYRDMNKLVGKVVPIMNDSEIDILLLSHYRNETQTLTSAAEANLLKYKELTNSLNETEAERWIAIKETFVKNNKLKSFGGQNEMAQMLSQIMQFTEHVEGIKEILRKGVEDK